MKLNGSKSSAVAVFVLISALATGCNGSGTKKASTVIVPSATDTASPLALPSSTQPASGPTATTDSSGQLVGHWAGSYVSQKYASTTGNFTIDFTQNGNALGGTISIPPNCDNGSINGTLSGTAIDLGAVKCPTSAVSFKGTVSGSHLQGTFTSSGSAGTDHGTWEASRA